MAQPTAAPFPNSHHPPLLPGACRCPPAGHLHQGLLCAVAQHDAHQRERGGPQGGLRGAAQRGATRGGCALRRADGARLHAGWLCWEWLAGVSGVPQLQLTGLSG